MSITQTLFITVYVIRQYQQRDVIGFWSIQITKDLEPTHKELI